MGINGFKAVKGVRGLYHRNNDIYYASLSVGGKKTRQFLRTKLKLVARPQLAKINRDLREIEVLRDMMNMNLKFNSVSLYRLIVS